MSGYENITLSNWNEVTLFADKHLCIKPSYLERVIDKDNSVPNVVFSKGQMASKAWMLEAMKQCSLDTLYQQKVIAILGCWVGMQVEFIVDLMRPERVYGFDELPYCIHAAELFNSHHVQNEWKFKGVVADVNTLKTNDMEFETSGELICVTPDIVINTSSEHMSNEWFDTSTDQVIVMQTNDSDEEEGHINTCKSIIEMREKYPLKEVWFVGQMKMPTYTRFMQIGLS